MTTGLLRKLANAVPKRAVAEEVPEKQALVVAQGKSASMTR